MNLRQIQDIAGHRDVPPWVVKLVQDCIEHDRTWEREKQQVVSSKMEHTSQEPVAKFLEDNLVVENERVDKSGHRVLEIREEELLRIMEIYAAPVRTKDLTDDEIERALDAAKVPELPDGYKSVDLEIARAVIAADREKNKCLKVK